MQLLDHVDLTDNMESIKHAGLGAAGGLASGLPSWKSLSWGQLLGCVPAGAIVGPLLTNLIPLVWKDAPHELLYAASFFIGTGATIILAMCTAWWQMIQRRNFFAKLLAAKLGTPTGDEPTTPLPPTRERKPVS